MPLSFLMIVVCLEGCHGCGKTGLWSQFRAAGFDVLDEAFLDMPPCPFPLHPQSLLLETSWVVTWFLRLLRHAEETKGREGPEQVFVADRSPFSAVMYGSNGHLLEPVIRAQAQEVLSAANILLFTVCLQVEPDQLWSRICSRLTREPERAKYREDDRAWMDRVLERYGGFEWDVVVDCGAHGSLPALFRAAFDQVLARCPRFREAVTRPGDFTLPPL